jgi:hypothetical protein
MAGLLLAVPVFRAIDQNGEPMSGAQLQFYLTGSTTPNNVYTSASLATPLSNPVIADSGGLFPPIYLDPTVTYRAELLSSTGSVIANVDPVSESVVEASQVQVNAGAATGVYVSPAKLAAWTGVAAALGYTPLNKAGDMATNLTLNSAASPTLYSAGYLGAPVNEQDAAYTLALNNAGELTRGNSASAIAWTIPPVASVAWPIGTMLVFRNVGAGVVSITRGTGVTLMLAGSGTSKDVALAQYGLATAVMEATNVWVISGVGIS